jgi:hypothetical protein
MMTGIPLGTMTTNVTAMAGAEETTMTAVVVEDTMMLEMVVVDVSGAAVVKARPTGDLPPPTVSYHCRNARGRLLAGTSMLRDMSSTRLSRRSRQVGMSFFHPRA